MFAINLTRPLASLVQIFGVRRQEKAAPRGPLPTWINDRELSEQLLKDTGLSVEDLAGCPSYDAKKPFFMQQNWG